MWIKRECLLCKKTFFTIPSVVSKGHGKFCSRECHYRSNIGHIPWNKGMKGICLNTGRTHFKKGKKDELFEKNRIEKIPRGENHYNWKTGKELTKRGYIIIYQPNHPHAHKGKIYEHIFLMEQKIGRYLKPGELVHHINCIKTDNRIENLMLFKNNTEHIKEHMRIKHENKK